MGSMPKADLMARGDEMRERIKKFIREYHVDNGVAPSLTEIADGVGLSSHNAVRTHLLLLQARGEVTWQPGKYRTIRVIDPEPVAPPKKTAAPKKAAAAPPKKGSQRKR